MIAVGDTLPPITFTRLTADGMETVDNGYFAGRTVVLFAVPGAFTPTCSQAHLPGYVVLADKLKAGGVDAIACVAVNDAFVMKAWGDSQNADAIDMLADGDGSVHKALGLSMETGSFGGTRAQRYAMVIKDNVVTLLNVEAPKAFEVSDAETVLKALNL
ncbi:peroxiredoxin [Ferrimonas balearica]|uniref:peroxiredoxin n=1 Tax=Ferrimonas balearica TaxID=44012 RepID=UPI001C98EA94|nr:peroxiredoxin [Ferrimonas balearica]MBY5920852.1 peroxiredoxin [Ferrimonas balearica]MBY5996463.1 peroxiredoxin [Ferrimonas balearica]